MRHIILLDTKISDKDFSAWCKEDIAFWKEQLGITPTYAAIRIDYSDYPTYVDSDGDIRPTNTYLKGLNAIAIKSEGGFGTDFVMMMVHSDNWRSDTETTKGIWGTNYSYVFGSQCFEYCRWDKKKVANTFGVAYHERHHSFDAIIKQELGIDILPILKVKAYDHGITHGNETPWKYIRYKENLDSLAIMKPYLVKAFAERKRKHEEIVKGLMETVISLATKVLYLLRMQYNKKEGISLS